MIDGIDRVTVTAHYDDLGRARSIFIYLNDDNLSPADVTAAVRALFRPDRTTWNDVTVGNPQVRVNGAALDANDKPPWF